MDKNTNSCGCGCSKKEAREELPGAAVNAADNDKVDEKLVEERTDTLNNNPRNTDVQMP